MSRPNIVLIFTDQQRWDTIHAAGNSVIKTPNLDRLVAEGTLYSSAYTPSPVCVPARCSLIYGQYPHRTRCFDNGYAMPDDRPSLMQLLTEAGYRTHGIGKMHFTPDPWALRGFETRDRQEELVQRAEDDDYITFLRANGFDHVYDPFGQRGEMYYIPQIAQMPQRLHGTNWVGDRAVEFIHHTDDSRPFFLWVSFIHPHPPFSPPTPWNKLYRAALMPLPNKPPGYQTLHTYANRFQNRYKYRDRGIDENLVRTIKAYYYACISFIDFQVGRILSALEEEGQIDNTLILFTSDHGEFLGDYDCFGKRSMLDAASRIPLIARYPESFPAGTACETPASLVDLMPTFLSVAGLETSGLELDGMDLRRLLALEDRTVFSQYQEGPLGVYMAVNRRWKYFYSSPDRREFLFDRLTDPRESRNRAGLSLCAKEKMAMKSRLIEFYSRSGYEEPLDGNEWRHFPQPRIPDDPDAGLLIQDAPWSVGFQRIPGYTD